MLSSVLEPEAIVTGKRPSFYRPELDALRFVAFLSVFLYHVSYLPEQRSRLWASLWYAGAFGMCLFFVLSSYLITKLLMKERAATGTVKIPYFYARRLLRIWPLYFTFLAAVSCIGLRYHPWHVKAGTVASFATLTGNWYLIVSGVTGPVMPLWSISLEEQFYLFWPTIFSIVSRRAFAAFCLALIPVSLIAIVVLYQRGGYFANIWWNTLSQLQFFGMGGLLAIYEDRLRQSLSPAYRVVLFLAGAAAWLMGGLVNGLAFERVPYAALYVVLPYPLAGIGCLLIFQAFFGASRIPSVFRYLGAISYGLYVFHLAALDFAGAVVHHAHLPYRIASTAFLGLVAALIAAGYSYKLLEVPFLRFKRHFEIVHSR